MVVTYCIMTHKSQLVNISPICKCRPYSAGLEREGAVCAYCWWSCHIKYSILYIKSEFLSLSKSVDVYDFFSVLVSKLPMELPFQIYIYYSLQNEFQNLFKPACPTSGLSLAIPAASPSVLAHLPPSAVGNSPPEAQCVLTPS